MNIFNLLTKENKGAGIDISDSFVRVAFFRTLKKKTKEKSRELVLIKEPIPAGIIDQGIVVNKVLLGKILKTIWTKANLGGYYAIVAIPSDKVYARIFSFPKSVNESRLNEAMRLAISYQLPQNINEVYLDWSHVSDTHLLNEVFLTTISKSIANAYIDALETAGIKTLALESHLTSIGRAIKLKIDQAFLLTEKTNSGSTVFILKNDVVRFSRVLPSKFLSESKIKKEIENIKTFFESENKEVLIEMPLDESLIRDEYMLPEISKLSPEVQSKWIVALGAAIRGEIPKGEDHLVSLLPVGTEEAYRYQKETNFITLIRNLIITVCLFFTLAFIAVYLFIFSLAQISANSVASLPVYPISLELLEKESLLEQVNALTLTSKNILSTIPLWSSVLDEINTRNIDGIIISNYTAPSILDKMSMTGTARDRATLNKFKKTLQDSLIFHQVELPIANLEQKGNIPFIISFYLKNPSMLYYK